jgi:polysaccharide biosynthesis protein PslH
MNILFLSNVYPWSAATGITQRVFHLLEAMRRRHSVTLVCPDPRDGCNSQVPVPASSVRTITLPGSTVRFGANVERDMWSPVSTRLRQLTGSPFPLHAQTRSEGQFLRVVDELCQDTAFDLVWVERAYLAELARRAGCRNIWVDLPDLEFESLKRTLRHSPFYRSKLLHYAELLKVYFYERIALPRRVQALVVCKQADRAFFGRFSDKVRVIPNGTDIVPPVTAVADPTPTVLFVGTLSYPPNVDAIRFFCREILPRILCSLPETRILVVGRNASADVMALHDGDRCTVVSSPSTVGPFYDRAWVSIVPMRLGSGTRLKVLEALCRGLPVVSTSVGCEGLELVPDRDLRVADSPQAFAEACVQLLQSRDARARTGQAGREAVITRYAWRSIENTCLDLLETPAGQM